MVKNKQFRTWLGPGLLSIEVLRILILQQSFSSHLNYVLQYTTEPN